ncbi:MAG: HAMP domain-containing histidine kinase [Saprospiraceae bacterium]|nr:HAMP domain-containing histidine kinase [Saprospiraceae bacterium]
MQLLTKTTLYYLLISIFVFGIGGVVAYNLISDEISLETDYYLRGILDRIDNRLEHYVENDLDVSRMNGTRVQIREVHDLEPSDPIYTDTLAMHPHLNQMEMMRKLYSVREVNGHKFEVAITDVIVEDSDIYESVVKIITRLFVLLALALLIGGVIISRFLMNPFNETLSAIDSFAVKDLAPVNLPKSSTKEFKQLNTFVKNMTERARSEYQALKSFSENASHELQTPLAIAKGKLDLLLEGQTLTEEQYKNILSAQNSLSRISKLGRSLSILTKMDNQEFDPSETTDVSNLVNDSLEDFRELFDLKKLNLRSYISPKVTAKLNKHLGTILINNLLHNAIRHNIEGGEVEVTLTENELRVENSGAKPEKPRTHMFSRFSKDDGTSESSGLGLAIVKEICDYHRLAVDYTYNGKHQLVVQL